jgi:hypothetical protein
MVQGSIFKCSPPVPREGWSGLFEPEMDLRPAGE